VKQRIYCEHHIQYEHPTYKSMQNITVWTTKGEHRILGLIQWYTKIFLTKGFIRALKVFIAQREDDAVEVKGGDWENEHPRA